MSLGTMCHPITLKMLGWPQPLFVYHLNYNIEGLSDYLVGQQSGATTNINNRAGRTKA